MERKWGKLINIIASIPIIKKLLEKRMDGKLQIITANYHIIEDNVKLYFGKEILTDIIYNDDNNDVIKQNIELFNSFKTNKFTANLTKNAKTGPEIIIANAAYILNQYTLHETTWFIGTDPLYRNTNDPEEDYPENPTSDQTGFNSELYS